MKNYSPRIFTICAVFIFSILVTSCSSKDYENNPVQDFPNTSDSQSDSGNWDSGSIWDEESCNDPDDIDCDGTSNRFDFDLDGDGIPNTNDSDMDGDGLLNIQDRDDNGDGWADGNNAFDADGDGVISPNFQPGTPRDPFDTDGDGIPNGADWDKDGDGIAD
jgi:hypothetical protein